MDNQEKSDRLSEAAAVLLESSYSHELKVVVLNKSLFYADLVCLRDYGQTFTGNPYVALEMGPVVAKYASRLVNQLANRGIAVQKIDGNARPLELVEMPKLSYCVGKYRDVFETVASHFEKMDSFDASEYSHENLGWKMAWNRGGKISPKKLPIDMNIAMQQIADGDDWLGDELTDPEKKSIELIEPGVGAEW